MSLNLNLSAKQIQQDFADEQKRSASLIRYLRLIADLYEQHGSTELVAQRLSEALDGNGNPETAKALVDGVRGGMLRLLLTIELEWRERKVLGARDGN